MKKFLQKPFKYSLTKNILLILAILAVGYIIINLSLRLITRHNQELTVPDLTGMSLAQAVAVAEEADLRLEVTDSVFIRGMERGAISRQNPTAGSKVKKNRRILLVINSIVPRQSTMPSLIGFSLRQARTELTSNGLRVGRLLYTEDMATDNVLAQQLYGKDIEPGTRLNSGTAIDLVLGLNPTDSITFVPNVIGYRYQMAIELLHDNSLNIYRSEFDGTVATYADSLEAYVYGQYPPASDSIGIHRGAPVTLYLSKDISRIPEPEPDSTDVLL